MLIITDPILGLSDPLCPPSHALWGAWRVPWTRDQPCSTGRGDDGAI